MFESAVKNRDPNRDSLLLTAIDAIEGALTKANTNAAIALIEDQIELQLDRMFRIIIEYDDFDLFKSAIHLLTLTVSQSVPNLISGIEAEVLESNTTDPQMRRKVEQLEYGLRYSARQFDKILGIRDLIINLQPQKQGGGDLLDEDFRRDILSLYTNSLLLRLSSMVLVNLLFLYRQKKLEKDALIDYLNVLWHHTTPDDADAIIANVPPVPSDPLWVTLLYLYGGSNSRIWHDRYYFEDFHGTKRYVTESYLLELAKIAKPIPSPSDSEISKYADLGLCEELGELYELSQEFVSATESQDFKQELSDLPKLELDSFLTVGKLSRPDHTWLQDLSEVIEDAQKRYSRARDLIEGHLPLDTTKTRLCISEIRSAHQSESLVEDIARLTSCQDLAQLNSLKLFSNSFPPVPKHCLIKNANVDCTLIWWEIGRSIAWQETAHVYAVSSGLKPASAVIEKYDPDHILEIIAEEVKKMNESGVNPNLAFVPLSLLSDWRSLGKIKYDKGVTLPVSGANLRLIHSWKGFEFQDVVIVDRTRCQWLYQEFEGSRLKCCIPPMKSGLVGIEIEAESRGLFVPEPEGVRLVNLRQVRQL